MKKRIIVIGGYGQVGRVVSTWLGARYPGLVFAAGRRLEPAKTLSDETGGRVQPLQLDLNHLSDPARLLDGVRLVVASIERPRDDHLVRSCIVNGVHYVEVATSFETLARILALRGLAESGGAAVIAGVGLIPGLSNVLAAHLARLVGQVRQVDVHLMLGLGDTHGLDAIRWMMEYMDRAFTVQTRNGPRQVESLTDPQWVLFPGDRKPRTTYRFDFADQHVLPETIGAAGAATYLCFDSRFITWLLAAAKRLGLVGAARKLSPAIMACLLERLRIGSDRFALKVVVEAEGPGVRVEAAVTGHVEAHATGIVTALAAQALYEGRIPAGVHHLEQVLRLDDLRAGLDEAGIRLWLPTH